MPTGYAWHWPGDSWIDLQLQSIGWRFVRRENFSILGEEEAANEDHRLSMKPRENRFEDPPRVIGVFVCGADRRRKVFLTSDHMVIRTLWRNWRRWAKEAGVPQPLARMPRPFPGSPPDQRHIPFALRSGYTAPVGDLGMCVVCGADHHPRCDDRRYMGDDLQPLPGWGPDGSPPAPLGDPVTPVS